MLRIINAAILTALIQRRQLDNAENWMTEQLGVSIPLSEWALLDPSV